MNRRSFLIASTAALLTNCKTRTDIGYFSAATHNAVIADPRGYLPTLYSNKRSTFISDLGGSFASAPEALLRTAFAAILSFDMKPYGTSNALTLTDCLMATSLDCDNYCVLAGEFARILGGADPAMVGWNGGAVGNHAQMLADANGEHLFCDPTIGFVALDVTLSGLCRGYAPSTGRYKSFFSYNASRAPDESSFDATVENAVIKGSYMASDILYFAPNIDKYRKMPGSSMWSTPQSWNIK